MLGISLLRAVKVPMILISILVQNMVLYVMRVEVFRRQMAVGLV